MKNNIAKDMFNITNNAFLSSGVLEYDSEDIYLTALISYVSE